MMIYLQPIINTSRHTTVTKKEHECSVLHDSVLGQSQESRMSGMTLPLESTRVIIVAGVHFQVISAGNTPEIVTICGMVDTLSIDACQISNPLLKHFIKSR